jgi:ankyrin repeat domain-containing protein 50
LPQGLYAFYGQAFDRIEGQEDSDRELATRALCFIFCARRTLTLDELLHALSVELGDSEFCVDNCTNSQILLSLCAGLILVDETLGNVGLVHYTLQEYFQKHPKMLPESPNAMVAEACLTYLSFDAFDSGPCTDGESLEKRLEEYCFLHYASSHWGHHAKHATSEDLEDLILKFVGHGSLLASSLQVLHTNHTRVNNWYDRFPRDFGALHAAAYWGLAPIMSKLLDEVDDLDVEDSLGSTPLQYAAQNGNTQVIWSLLEKGAAINQRNKKGRTALALAARSGFKDVVDVLLKAETDPLTEDDEGWMPLHGPL